MGTGIGTYEFRLASPGKIEPTANRQRIKVPDATPEIVKKYAPGTDEQALLTKVRYNRLVDLFAGLTCYSIQNHLRTTIQNVGQIEIDELYMGIDKHGCHYVIPVQAKGGNDQIGYVQIDQDVKFATQKFPDMRCRAIAAQFLSSNTVVLFEITIREDELKVVEEKHYRLVDGKSFDSSTATRYRGT